MNCNECSNRSIKHKLEFSGILTHTDGYVYMLYTCNKCNRVKKKRTSIIYNRKLLKNEQVDFWWNER